MKVLHQTSYKGEFFSVFMFENENESYTWGQFYLGLKDNIDLILQDHFFKIMFERKLLSIQSLYNSKRFNNFFPLVVATQRFTVRTSLAIMKYIWQS